MASTDTANIYADGSGYSGPLTMWRMTWDELLAYCLAKPGAWQDEPWEGDVVAKVGQKIFAFLGAGIAGRDGPSVGLKCAASREAADEWLLRFPADASAMRYIGRSGWNTLAVGGSIPDDEIREAVDASYAMVVTKLPKRDRPVSLPRRPRVGPQPARLRRTWDTSGPSGGSKYPTSSPSTR